MICLSRLGKLTVIAGGILSVPLLYAELPSAGNSSGVVVSSSSQGGYLGVVLHDVDADRANALKLKDAHGAEIVTVDQDAPAVKAGLKVHDVVVQMNGQRVEGVEQFRRMLRETPPGRTVALVVMRDGQAVNLSAQLADRNSVAIIPLDPLIQLPDGTDEPKVEAWAIPKGSGKHSGTSSLLGYFTRDRDYTGVQLQPLTSGLAEYFGVHNGLGVLVGTVFPNTPAAAAGLKAADVIQKVNGQPIVTLSDWDKAIHANRGKTVQVTLIRDKKEQTVAMVAGEAKSSSALEVPDADTLAQLDSNVIQIDPSAIADQVRESMKGIDVEAIQKQAEEAARNFDAKQLDKALAESAKQFEMDRKQMQQQMDDLKKEFQSLRIEQMD